MTVSDYYLFIFLFVLSFASQYDHIPMHETYLNPRHSGSAAKLLKLHPGEGKKKIPLGQCIKNIKCDNEVEGVAINTQKEL